MDYQLTPKDLEVVRLIAETGSLTATAERAHVTQPAISQRLSNIEERIGTILFVRGRGGMRATPAALRLGEAALTVDRVIGQAMTDVHQLIESRQRKLRVTAQCQTSYRWLSFVIRDLVALHPELSVDVVPEAVEDPYGAIERDEVDAALVYLAREYSNAREVRLFDDELYAVMHESHPLAQRSYLNPGNFAAETLILYTGRQHAFVDNFLRPAGVVPARIRQVRMTEALIELARAGQGITIVAGWVLNDHNREGLSAVRITRGGYRRTWRALFGAHCSKDLAEHFATSIRQTAEAMSKDGWRDALADHWTCVGEGRCEGGRR